jgi:hypothetical protein
MPLGNPGGAKVDGEQDHSLAGGPSSLQVLEALDFAAM